MTTTGQARESVMDAFRSLARRGSKAEGEDPSLTVRRAPGVARDGSVVALLACVDARGWSFHKGDKVISKGRTAEDRVYFSRVDSSLKMAFIEGRWVDSCDG